MENPENKRSHAIDTLRGIAILLVLCRHMPLSDKLPDWLLAPLRVIHTGGWAGVDLFFVLSGFLVSGLLFQEFKKSGKMRAGRFLIRRGFKIYPAFYVMLAVTFGWFAYRGVWKGWNWFLYEALFVQNYWPSVFPHTWSLAVEEHFYLALPLILFAFRGPRESPFRALPAFVAIVAIAVLAMRLLASHESPIASREHYTPTHLRCDSLFFGVLLSWAYHFRRVAWDRISERFNWVLPIAGIALMAPAFIWPIETTRAITTWGFTSFYLGAGALLVWFIRHNLAIRPVATIGFYSYSIYLWHIPLSRIVAPMIHGPNPDPMLSLGTYFALCLAVGIALAWLIELPALKFRDRVT